jgi:hypothetical protein
MLCTLSEQLLFHVIEKVGITKVTEHSLAQTGAHSKEVSEKTKEAFSELSSVNTVMTSYQHSQD